MPWQPTWVMVEWQSSLAVLPLRAMHRGSLRWTDMEMPVHHLQGSTRGLR
jgi:hypothetical protein